MAKTTEDAGMNLPRYVRRRPSGTYRFQRNVPTHLRKKLGTKDIYRSLGATYNEMLLSLPRVMLEVEAMFSATEGQTERQRLLSLVRGEFGEQAATDLDAGKISRDLSFGLMDLSDKLDEPVLYSGNLPKDAMSLSKAIQLYAEFKDAVSNKKLRNSLAQALKDLNTYVGIERVSKIDIRELVREDALAYRDGLLQRVSPNSVERYVNIVRAVVNHAINEKGLKTTNVFTSLKVKGAGHTQTARDAFTAIEAQRASEAFSDGSIFETLFTVLRDTGCRMAEITGLEVQDVNLQERYIEVRPNSVRGLKSDSATRKVPLSQRATECLLEHRVGKEYTEAMFPRYAKEGGASSCSAAMTKRLRTVISNRKLVIHSLRHSKKDQLREVDCPEQISKVLLGHSNQEISSKYGKGYSVEKLREWMSKTWDKGSQTD